MITSLMKFAAAAFLAMGTSVAADSWTLDASTSKVAFGSVKKDNIGEVHSFEAMTGSVASDGSVAVEIDLSSVQTNIDIRNERIIEHVFKNAKSANLNASIDMNELKALPVGATTLIDVEGVLSFLGATIDIEAEMFVARLSDTQVMVTTNDLIWLATEDAGITAGIDKLMELAELPSITRAAPVTMRLIFNLDEQKAEAAPAAPATLAAVSGDPGAGKKVFRKCKACHQIKEGRNGAGPSLYQIVGAPAGQVEGFKYSKALSDSDLVWDVETLTAFLAGPKKFVPGTKMAFPGLKKDEDIENLITYLTNP
ncbi:MAG: cytochrome c family protein [Paracoccaceae bacterium]